MGYNRAYRWSRRLFPRLQEADFEDIFQVGFYTYLMGMEPRPHALFCRIVDAARAEWGRNSQRRPKLMPIDDRVTGTVDQDWLEIRDIVASLDMPRRARIIVACKVLGLTHAEIGDLIGVSGERVTQIMREERRRASSIGWT
ncbi:MAG TPA: sigma-70 family RNA polymerase sigma factor [Planctomycetaceae bacterium]|nr:sigma-70 family RNA polymerase sigma factor [Planctomycetaceae bacterium]